MPCYLFTYHGYLTWLPDRKQGFVRRTHGLLPQDESLGEQYREHATESEVRFTEPEQQLIIDEARIVAEKQSFRLHYVATETSHVHVLVSWKDDRPWKRLRTAIKTSFSLRLKREIADRTWFSDGSSRKRVDEQSHFEFLMSSYLPKHSGLIWREGSEKESTERMKDTENKTENKTARAVGPRLAGCVLIVAVTSAYDDAFTWIRDRTASTWSPIALSSDVFTFSETDYYEATMGKDLKKSFFAFEQLIDPATLPDVKIQTNRWEEEFAESRQLDVPRPLNLDPGYVTEGKLVLASTKDHAHRIYLRDGIYAEVTLHFRNKAWQKSAWTYPDYQRDDFQAFFSKCREYVKMTRRSESSAKH